MTRVIALEIVGFRAFGRERQVFEFEKNLAVIYAPNSQGKTSFAESLEFLLTGTTTRRELIGSAVREFADALRNAHLHDGEQVSVRATLELRDGSRRVIERTLVTDCSSKGDCSSVLTIDGVTVRDVSGLGITLAQPPLAAPILMPHGLRYVFQAEPSQRVAYFKMLLEMSDLDDLRRRIAGLELNPTAATNDTLTKFEVCAKNAVFGLRLSECEGSPTVTRIALGEAIALAAGGGTLPNSLDDKVAYLHKLLAEKQQAVFPLDALEPGAAAVWKIPAPSLLGDVLEYRRLLATIDADLARVEALYSTLLEIPVYRGLHPTASATCPVCRTDSALTGARIEEIRIALKSSSVVGAARRKAAASLRDVQAHVSKARGLANGCKPLLFGWGAEERARRGFSMAYWQSCSVSRAMRH